MRRSSSILFGGVNAGRLTKARLAAGFRSGKAAAEAHGWPIGTYTADESGRRTMTADRALRYATAFAVPSAWLMGQESTDGTPDQLRRAAELDKLSEDEVPRVFSSPDIEAKAREGAGMRLTQARVDGGFPSVRAAARHLGLPASTCHGHENGQNNIGEHAARLYGLAYGADINWLMTGMPAKEGDGRPTGRAKGDPTEIAELVAELRLPSAARNAVAGIEFPRLSRDALHLLVGALSHEATGPFFVASVVDAQDGEGAAVGDRVVIDAGGAGGNGLLARSHPDGGIRLVCRTSGMALPSDVVGRVLAIVKPARGVLRD